MRNQYSKQIMHATSINKPKKLLTSFQKYKHLKMLSHQPSVTHQADNYVKECYLTVVKKF